MKNLLNRILGDANRPIDVNSSVTLFAAVYMGIVGPEVFILQPGFVQGLVQYLGFSATGAGYIASAEMWGLAITTVILTFLAGRFNWRHIFVVSLIIIIIGNLVSVLVTAPFSFGIWRFITGLGCGGLVSLSFTVIGITDNPDRNFGYYIMWVLIYGALGLLLMPIAYSTIGMQGVIVFFALLPAAGLFLVRFLPVSGAAHVQVDADAVNLPAHFKGMALAAMFSYFLAQGVVWAYLFLIGINGGASEQEVANGLTVSQFLGIAGAFTTVMVGIRYGRALPLLVGISAGIVPLLFLFGTMGALAFGIAVSVYNYAWNMTHPYLLASMASFDRTGRVVVNAVAFQMLGLAIGPAIAATVISDGDYSNVNFLGMGLFTAALVLILPPVMKQKSLATVVASA
jgi:MFS family permease